MMIRVFLSINMIMLFTACNLDNKMPISKLATYVNEIEQGTTGDPIMISKNNEGKYIIESTNQGLLADYWTSYDDDDTVLGYCYRIGGGRTNNATCYAYTLLDSNTPTIICSGIGHSHGFESEGDYLAYDSWDMSISTYVKNNETWEDAGNNILPLDLETNIAKYFEGTKVSLTNDGLYVDMYRDTTLQKKYNNYFGLEGLASATLSSGLERANKHFGATVDDNGTIIFHCGPKDYRIELQWNGEKYEYAHLPAVAMTEE